ncbi:phosphatase PAP2 family protein [Paenibacillus monticola]|uniref:phosphatase PAP2 family protein n=1 Tax=Paenibacillus monticola TaxID=2666075 RepID=UPI00189E5A4B|nr:phosphatase PAP2 family protein [Paenibacillus monticola]
MKKLQKQLPLLWLLSIPLIGILYTLQNHVRPVVHVLSTQFDRATPFIPFFSVFYFIWYPFIFITLYLILQQRRSAYYQTLAAVCFGILVANFTFLIFPTYVPRPQLGSGWNFFVPITYRLDEPYNGFPSIHVLTCYLMLRGAAILPKRSSWAVSIMACLIILSTLFIKQHVIADMAAGIALGEIVFRMTGRLIKERQQPLTQDSVVEL